MSDIQQPKPASLPKSFWFIAICGLVTGGFVALGERGEQLAAAKATAKAAEANAKTQRSTPSWKVPPTVSSRLASAGPQLPIAAPTSGDAVRTTVSESKPAEPLEPTSNKTIVLVALMALLGGAALLNKRRAFGFGDKGTQRLSVLETARIGGRFQVALVQAPGRVLVLGTSEKGLTLLTELEPEALDGPISLPLSTQPPDSQHKAADAPEANISPLVPPSPRHTPAKAAADSGEQFLDHLVDRLNAATPVGLERALAPAAPSAANPLARYRRSMA